jgi:uncharacterized membrane protein
MTAREPLQAEFTRRDVAQIAVGACAMAFPVAATEEIWTLSEELPLWRVMLFALASILFLALLIAALHHRDTLRAERKVFVRRVFSTYLVTLLVVVLLLIGLDRFDLFEPLVSFKRAILVAFPASFAATVVDGLK